MPCQFLPVLTLEFRDSSAYCQWAIQGSLLPVRQSARAKFILAESLTEVLPEHKQFACHLTVFSSIMPYLSDDSNVPTKSKQVLGAAIEN